MTTATSETVARSIDVTAWANLLLAIALLNGGNLLLDAVAKDACITLNFLLTLQFLSAGFLAAIACLGLAFLFYVRSLAKLPLAVAYPVMVGVSMIVVAVANHVWGASALSVLQMAGVAVLFLGVLLVSTSPRAH
jgi:multidrug transporter EmrE-like cation transporter